MQWLGFITACWWVENSQFVLGTLSLMHAAFGLGVRHVEEAVHRSPELVR